MPTLSKDGVPDECPQPRRQLKNKKNRGLDLRLDALIFADRKGRATGMSCPPSVRPSLKDVLWLTARA